jgi:lysyl-tRNA synthetase class 2
VADHWQPGIDPSSLRYRSELLQSLRSFFQQRQVIEVDVPVLARSTVTDINIESVNALASGNSGYLQTSPEYFMKRLLAAGSGDIFCLGKAFRDAESGRRHNPEFTLLEWYRCGWDEHQLIDEVAELISQLASLSADAQLAVTKLSYGECFKSVLGVDPHSAKLASLQQMAVDASSESWAQESRANCLDLLFSLSVEPQLPNGLVFIYDYPACQAALAQLHLNVQGQSVSRRFEVFFNSMELANGYMELTDAAQQRQRFEKEVELRSAQNKPAVVIDEKLMAALDSGLPPCAGVALGVDRLLMQLLGTDAIDQVMAFSWQRC